MKREGPLEEFSGVVERVTFHQPDTGFAVLRVKHRGRRDPVTVVTHVPSIQAGEYIHCSGTWINNAKFGLQFSAQQIRVSLPDTAEGIQKYLASGMVRGIGPHYAKQLVSHFGVQLFDVLDKHPHRLSEVSGIGAIRKKQILASWKEQRKIRDIMMFLHGHGVGTSRAVRIYKTYGDEAIERIQKDPYQLAKDIRGIGFKTADQLAQQLGIPRDSLIRARAGTIHALYEATEQGHCAQLREELVGATMALLEIPEALVQQALTDNLSAKECILVEAEEQAYIYLAPIYQAETGIAKEIHRLQKLGLLPWGRIDLEKALSDVQEKNQVQLSLSQQEAVKKVLSHKVSIITGGPGVGKTTVLKSLLNIIQSQKMNIQLCAPTGRAAKRMFESTAMEAKTIHRLLEFDPQTGGFKHHREWPLTCDVLVVDEASMIDVYLMNHLLKAVPGHAAVILVGDVDQLPSVGPGCVLNDLIESEVLPTARMTEIFRQAKTSKIIVNAHRINQGEMPHILTQDTDFYCMYEEDPEILQKKILELVTRRIPHKWGFDPIADIQVLSPMNRGALGSRSLNPLLQERLNPHAADETQGIVRFGTKFSVGDKVIQQVNNYDKDVFNGDIGLIESINHEETCFTLVFDGRRVRYDFSEMDELSLAYVTSIHKAQGSEYPAVVIPLAMQHFTLLERKLLYTAVTRGRRLVVLVAQKKALIMAVKSRTKKERVTQLRRWMQQLASKQYG